jgi:ketosteroid isomerase-like protein
MNSRHPLYAVISAALGSTNLLKATVVSLALLPSMSLADNQRAAIDALIDGLHQDAHEGNFQTYFDRYTPDAVFLGTDKSERWTIDQFKVYAEPAFEDGHGWTYSVKERNWEGEGTTRWFDEVLLNEKLGHCRGTGVVEFIDGEWKIAHYALTMLVPNDIAAEIGAQTQRADGIVQK